MSPQDISPSGLPKHTPNEDSTKRIELLQQDVIQAIERTIAIVAKYDSLEEIQFSSDVESKLKPMEEVQGALQNAQELSLRMAVVAPMKAGKSTITNAIVGQEILPSRNSAMTALPTEIILSEEYKEPILTLSEETLDIFREVIDSIQNIFYIDMEGTNQKVGKSYPHLVETLKIFIDNGKDLFALKTEGCTNICSVLKLINDLVRISSVLIPKNNPIQRIYDIPQIYAAPFYVNTDEKMANKSLGNLVIIDTPGPNEAGENLEIRSIFAEQLKRSSIVLIVLDFTQLNAVAAEEVSTVVQEIAKIRGEGDSIYAVVNKIDQRTEGDMSTEETQAFVQKDFRIDSNHVFEISARSAFVAIKFLEDLHKNDSIPLDKIESARQLARELWKVDWEEELSEIDEKRLLKKADKLLARSKFIEFTNSVIDELMVIAAPNSLHKSLNTCINYLIEIKNNVDIRRATNKKKARELTDQIDELQSDLERLNVAINAVNVISQYKHRLDQTLKAELNILKSKTSVNVGNIFKEEQYNQADLPQKIFLSFKSLTDHYSSSINEQSYNNGVVQFNSQSDAIAFQNKIIELVQTKAEVRLADIQEKVEKEINYTRDKLLLEIQTKALPIITKAQNRLNIELDLKLSLPDLRISRFRSPDIKSSPEYRYEKAKTKTVMERPPIRFLKSWFGWNISNPFAAPKPREVPISPEKRYYVIQLSQLVNDMNRWINDSINQINNDITDYLEDDFKSEVDQYQDGLNQYLKNYSDSLKKGLNDQKKSSELREKLENDLVTISRDSASLLDVNSPNSLASLMPKVQELLPKKDQDISSRF